MAYTTAAAAAAAAAAVLQTERNVLHQDYTVQEIFHGQVKRLLYVHDVIPPVTVGFHFICGK